MINSGTKLSHRFTLPNELFSLGLSAKAIAVYAYLLYREDRKTHQCWPSYATIGNGVHLSENSVKKYVDELVEKCLIYAEHTTVTTKDGKLRNGTLKYSIRPIEGAVEYHHRQQLKAAEFERKRREAIKRLEDYVKKDPSTTLAFTPTDHPPAA